MYRISVGLHACHPARLCSAPSAQERALAQQPSAPRSSLHPLTFSFNVFFSGSSPWMSTFPSNPPFYFLSPRVFFNFPPSFFFFNSSPLFPPPPQKTQLFLHLFPLLSPSHLELFSCRSSFQAQCHHQSFRCSVPHTPMPYTACSRAHSTQIPHPFSNCFPSADGKEADPVLL